MTSCVSHTTFDLPTPTPSATWWKPVLGYTDVPDDPNEPGDEECMILDPATGHRLLFIEYRRRQAGKNRVHLDLVPTDRTRDEEIDRVLGLGATEVADRRNARRHRLGGARRPGGQRVLHPPQRRRAGSG